MDNEIFERVQERLNAERNRNRHRNNHTYMLSGLLHCGDCGERMTRTSGKSKTGKHYYYYHCPNKHFGRINADDLELAVIHVIDDYLKPEKVKSIAKTAYVEYRKQILDNFEAEAAKKELNAVERKLKNAIEAVLNGFSSDTIKKNIIENLESQKAALTCKLDDLNRRSPDLSLEMFESTLKTLVYTPTASLIDSVIKRIDLFDDYIVVYFRFFDVDGELLEMVRSLG